MPESAATNVCLIERGLVTPIRSITDSVFAAKGGLVRAENCTFLPGRPLSLWRPFFEQKGMLTETDGETVIASNFNCGKLCFVTSDGTDTRLYFYDTDNIESVQAAAAKKIEGFVPSAADCCFSTGFAIFCLEGYDIVAVRDSDKKEFLFGSICHSKHNGKLARQIDLMEGDGQKELVFELHSAANVIISRVMLSLMRRNGSGFGSVRVRLSVGEDREAFSDAQLLGGIPQRVGTAPPKPFTFMITNGFEVNAGETVRVELVFNDVTFSGNDDSIFLEGCDEVTLKDGFSITENYYTAINGFYSPDACLCTAAQGRYFVCDSEGTVFSSAPTEPWVFDGYVSTGQEPNSLFATSGMVGVVSGSQTSVITGTFPDMLDSVQEVDFGCLDRDGIINLQGSILGVSNSQLVIFPGKLAGLPVLFEIASPYRLLYYSRYSLLLVQLLEGDYPVLVCDVPGYRATSWKLDEVGEPLCELFGDYALSASGKLFFLNSFKGDYEVVVQTAAIDTGTLNTVDKVRLFSLVREGTASLIYGIDELSLDGTPQTQWRQVDFTVQSYETEQDPGLCFFGNQIADIERHTSNCLSFGSQASGFLFSLKLDVAKTDVKTPGDLFLGFALSSTFEAARKES